MRRTVQIDPCGESCHLYFSIYNLIVATRITELLADRHRVTTTLWSLKQQAVVADINAWFVFFDYRENKTADIARVGGVYADLYAALKQQAKQSNPNGSRLVYRLIDVMIGNILFNDAKSNLAFCACSCFSRLTNFQKVHISQFIVRF